MNTISNIFEKAGITLLGLMVGVGAFELASGLPFG
jgi:hypothetical protein